MTSKKLYLEKNLIVYSKLNGNMLLILENNIKKLSNFFKIFEGW